MCSTSRPLLKSASGARQYSQRWPARAATRSYSLWGIWGRGEAPWPQIAAGQLDELFLGEVRLAASSLEHSLGILVHAQLSIDVEELGVALAQLAGQARDDLVELGVGSGDGLLPGCAVLGGLVGRVAVAVDRVAGPLDDADVAVVDVGRQEQGAAGRELGGRRGAFAPVQIENDDLRGGTVGPLVA